MNFTVDSNNFSNIAIYANLNHKYQAQFNFHFSKCVNQIIFNQTTAISTISFKDAVIYADTIEYLRRQYFVINDIGVEQIFERIGMLAGFYASAVLLRFEYPMMIVTRTREIFQKRLKRNKKMLTQQGSSDESRSNTLSRSIQLHTNTFLDSVNSSELSKRTAELRDELFPQFKQNRSEDKSYDSSIHDIHNPSVNEHHSSMLKKQIILTEESFADKLFKLSKNITLNQMIDAQTVEINLSPTQNQVISLICDFDQIDREATIQNYQKLRRREKENFTIQSEYVHGEEQNRFKKKEKIGMTHIDENGQYLNHQKTIQSPKYRRLPKQMQYSAMEKQLKSRTLYQTENNINPKMSTFIQTRNSLMLNTTDERFQELEESYKTLQRFRPSNFQSNQHQLRHIYNNNEGRNRGKATSYRQNYLPRHRSSNVFNVIRPTDELNQLDQFSRKRESQSYLNQVNSHPNRQHQQQTFVHVRSSHIDDGNSKFPPHRLPNHHQSRYVTEFDSSDQNQRTFNSPKFKDLKEQQKKQQKYTFKHQRLQRETKMPLLPITTEKLIVNQKVAPIEKYPQSRISLMQQLPLASYHQPNYEDRQEKKKRLREKAAQLLSRVKSHQYLTTRMQMAYPKRY